MVVVFFKINIEIVCFEVEVIMNSRFKDEISKSPKLSYLFIGVFMLCL